MSIQLTLILLTFLLANLPWFSDKLFYVYSFKTGNKSLIWCLFELLVFYLLMAGITSYAEIQVYGQLAKQGWEFYTVTFSLFLVFAFPGYIYKSQWR